MNGASFFDVIILATAILSFILSAYLGQTGFTGRFISIISVLFGTTLIVTGMLRLTPGDPVDHILGDQAPQEARIRLAQDLGLIDQNQKPVGFIAQYGQFIRDVSTNQLLSYRTREPVFNTIAQRLPYTAVLAFFAMLFALLMGPLLGVAAAYRKGSFVDGLAMFFAVIGISLPRFFLAPLLLLAFSIHWSLFPISGADDGFISVILPAISLGVAMAAVQARLTRASLLEVLNEDYIRSAKAKGLHPVKIYLKHALRNALMPLVTVIGLELGALLAGAVVTEKIFNWPGLGLLLLESIQRLDMPLVQGVVLTISISYVAINLLTDAVYQLIDPQIRLSTKESID